MAKGWECTNLHGIVRVQVHDRFVQLKVIYDDGTAPLVLRIPVDPIRRKAGFEITVKGRK